MKRTVAIAVMALMAVPLLFGAGKAKVKKEGNLKLGIWPEDTLTSEIKMHEQFVKDFSKTHPTISVTPQFYKYSTDTYVSLAEANMLPTIYETWFTEPQKLIRNGFARDITPQLKARGWIEKMNPSVANLMSKDGKIYGVPRDAYALGLMLNVELFEEAGLVDKNGIPLYPKTWDELAKTAKIIKDKTGSAGICLLAKDNAAGWHFTNIAWCFGAEFETFDKNGKVTAHINTPEVIAAMKYIQDLKWKYDVLTDDPTNEDWGTGFRQLGTGCAAMYIAAQDAVNQPTQVNGLELESLALVPIPAGPKGQYSLMGGTPYMFAKNATDKEIEAALDYLEIMGKSPDVTDKSVAGMKADAANRYNEGIPVIPPFPAWTDKALNQARENAERPYRNVNMALYNDYYKKTTEPTNLKTEEPISAQDLYAELTKVMQAVITNKNADIPSLLNKAQSNFQKILDTDYNNK